MKACLMHRWLVMPTSSGLDSKGLQLLQGDSLCFPLILLLGMKAKDLHSNTFLSPHFRRGSS